jgi:EAL domain-containing protein (putative c-di-GMP-specific phosphodiesterase class I)
MADTMKNIGCDLLQGYLYSKPVPADEFAEKYSEGRRA